MTEKKEFLGITMQGWMQIAIILVAVIFAFLLITWAGYGDVDYSGQSQPATAEFAECLTDQGAVFYGTDWCSHCRDQKKLFGEHFDKVNFIDCDEARAVCLSAGIEAYPTWIISKQKYLGTKSLDELGELTGCELA